MQSMINAAAAPPSDMTAETGLPKSMPDTSTRQNDTAAASDAEIVKNTSVMTIFASPGLIPGSGIHAPRGSTASMYESANAMHSAAASKHSLCIARDRSSRFAIGSAFPADTHCHARRKAHYALPGM